MAGARRPIPSRRARKNRDYYKAQLKAKVLDALRDSFGVDTSDDAIRAAIEKHNRLLSLIHILGMGPASQAGAEKVRAKMGIPAEVPVFLSLIHI